MIEIQKLYKNCEIHLKKPINKKEVFDFFNLNKYILDLKWDDLENELATKWTYNKFCTLLECVNSLSKQNFNVFVTKEELEGILEILELLKTKKNDWELNWKELSLYENLQLEYNFKKQQYNLNTINLLNHWSFDEVYEIEKIIFEKNSFVEILNKFIIPKAIIINDIDYGYTEEEKKYYANLTSSISEAHWSIERLYDIFNFDSHTSLERRRSMRKKAFELIFTTYFKDNTFKTDEEFKNNFFLGFDIALKEERKNNLDKEWWSLHNVFYGFISWKNIYKIPYIWYENQKSHYSFLCTIVDIMNILNNLIELDIKINNK